MPASSLALHRPGGRCLSQISDSNAYSQGQGNVRSDGEIQANAFAVSRQLDFGIEDVQVTDFQPV